MDLLSGNHLACRKDCRDTGDDAAIVINAFQTAFYGASGRCRCQKKKDMFAFDHVLEIIPEDHLSYRIEFRCDNIHCLMLIHRNDSGTGQLLCEIGTDHLCAIHTDDGIHNRGTDILTGDRPCSRSRHALT